MRAVLQPLNEKAKDIIVKHADLLQSSQMEPLLLQLVAHVSAYQVILQRCAESTQAPTVSVCPAQHIVGVVHLQYPLAKVEAGKLFACRFTCRRSI